ncbi:hypothetical protein HYZ97_04625 [Candidatus Pacearchaeota archaeon]|nr:hypothetical protein [Candidatus Pacearchaeota archaeon]
MLKENLDSYIPWCKSWLIRIGMLDLLHDHSHIRHFLAEQPLLNSDLQALKQVAAMWYENEEDVGESGTLCRFVTYARAFRRERHTLITHGTLNEREMTQPEIVLKKSLEEMLKLDGGTSQWASAALLVEQVPRIQEYLSLKNPPVKLQLTYEALMHWDKNINRGEPWEPRRDATIHRQAEAYLSYLKSRKLSFKPEHSEDYCFARAFSLITPEQGRMRWPSLQHHESNRLTEMESALKMLEEDFYIRSKDHRVVQACVMLQTALNLPYIVLYPESVNKSWPEFPAFMKYCRFYAPDHNSFKVIR